MITPYSADGTIDYSALEKLIDWYIENGVTGLFAVCQSSEMFHLSLAERLTLARACVKFARGRVPVIASGHVAETISDQVDEALAMADTGIDAIVLVSNRFVRKGESDDVFKHNLDAFLSSFHYDITLGFYECPAPYKRLLSPELVAHCAATGRFGFLKDTSCSMSSITAKLKIGNSNFKLFNANAATLLASLKAGAAGYSGVMTNFHPDLYSWICAHWMEEPESAAQLQDFLGLASVIECQLYPINAMYALQLEGLPVRLHSRRADARQFTESMRLEVEQMMRLSHRFSEKYRNRA
jgi:4-hydroxy-tetrahydrodipicolinate synthase